MFQAINIVKEFGKQEQMKKNERLQKKKNSKCQQFCMLIKKKKCLRAPRIDKLTSMVKQQGPADNNTNTPTKPISPSDGDAAGGPDSQT